MYKPLFCLIVLLLPFCCGLFTELSGVTNLKAKNFQSKSRDSDNVWLVNFYTSASQKSLKLAPEYLEVAEQMKGRVNVGGMNCKDHKEFCEQFGFRDSPVIRYFPAGLKSDPATYNGELKAKEIVKWALSHPRGDHAKPELVQLLNQNVFRENCEKRVLCVLAFLPPLLECQSDCRRSYMDLLQAEIVEFQRQGWGWAWSEGGTQMELERVLNVGGFGYPEIAIMSVKKMKSSSFTGSFESKAIRKFLTELSRGKGHKLDAISDVPEIKSVSMWNGMDQEPVQEEDVDLSDVELEDLGNEKEEL